MKINLNLLQLESFYVNKEFQNYVPKKYDWEKLWSKIKDKLSHINEISFFVNASTGKKDRLCDEKGFDILFNKIIYGCHSDLKNELEQKLEDIDLNGEKKIYECFCKMHTTTCSKEIIFCFLKNETIYPLILDLNHSIYKVSKEKSYRYQFNKQIDKPWNHKEQQHLINKKLFNR